VIKTKLFFREYAAVFFTLIFCPMMLIIFGGVYGNDPTPLFGNLGTVDISIPAFTGLVIAGAGLISLPISIAASREKGELRRFKMTPISPMTYLLMDVLVYFALCVVGIMIMVLIGYFMFDSTFKGNIFYTLLALLLSALSIFAMGLFISAISKTARAAQALGMFIGFPMMFLSGSGMPVELLPDSILKVSKYFPLYYATKLMRGVWEGGGLSAYTDEMLVLAGVAVLFMGLTFLFFKWE